MVALGAACSSPSERTADPALPSAEGCPDARAIGAAIGHTVVRLPFESIGQNQICDYGAAGVIEGQGDTGRMRVQISKAAMDNPVVASLDADLASGEIEVLDEAGGGETIRGGRYRETDTLMVWGAPVGGQVARIMVRAPSIAAPSSSDLLALIRKVATAADVDL